MIIKFLFKSLIYAAFLISIGCVANENSEKSDSLAPEAAAAQAELPFRDISILEKAYIDSSPADRKDSITVGELGVDGGNKAVIVKLAQEIADSKYGNF